LNKEMYESPPMETPFMRSGGRRRAKPGIMALMHKIVMQ
jgi:hypothetical protein